MLLLFMIIGKFSTLFTDVQDIASLKLPKLKIKPLYCLYPVKSTVINGTSMKFLECKETAFLIRES